MPGIKVRIAKDGQVRVEYDGFIGNACYAEAERLRLAFSSLGLQLDTKHVIDQKEEVEVRKLENQQSVRG